MNINKFEIVEKFMQEKWIPLYINNFIGNSEITKMFPVNPKNREDFETLLHDLLIIFNEEISTKRLELFNKPQSPCKIIK